MTRSSNPIILIVSCNAFRSNGYNDAIRNTWLQEWGRLIPHRFLIGRGCVDPLDDELVVDEGDNFSNAIYKSRAGQRWSNDQGYSHLFLACSDTYVAIPRLLASDFEKYDCVGDMLSSDPFPGGGCGYWLSARANEAMFLDDIRRYTGLETENHDLWTGRALAKAGLSLHNDDRYWTNSGNPGLFPYWDEKVWDTGIISVHLGQCPTPTRRSIYTSKEMINCHAAFMKNAK